MTIFLSEIDKQIAIIAKEIFTTYSKKLMAVNGSIAGLALLAGVLYIAALFTFQSYGIAFLLKGLLTIVLFCIAIASTSNWQVQLKHPDELIKMSFIVAGLNVLKALPKPFIVILIAIVTLIAIALDTFYMVQIQTITTTMPTNPAMHIIINFIVITSITICAGLTDPVLSSKVRSLHDNKYYIIFIAKASIANTAIYYVSCLFLDFGSLNIAIALGCFWSALVLIHIDSHPPIESKHTSNMEN